MKTLSKILGVLTFSICSVNAIEGDFLGHFKSAEAKVTQNTCTDEYGIFNIGLIAFLDFNILRSQIVELKKEGSTSSTTLFERSLKGHVISAVKFPEKLPIGVINEPEINYYSTNITLVNRHDISLPQEDGDSAEMGVGLNSQNEISVYLLELVSTKMDGASGKEVPCSIKMRVNSFSLN